MENVQEKQKFGEALEDFSLAAVSLASTSGGTVNLSQRLDGKRGAVVVFWSGVCSHCVRYDKYFNAFEQQHPKLSLDCSGISLVARRDARDDPQDHGRPEADIYLW